VTPPTGGGRPGVSHAYAAHRYAILFYALLLTLGAAPLFAALQVDVNVLQFFLAFSLLAALFGVPGRRLRTVLMLLAAVAIAVRAAPPSTVGVGLATGALVFTTVLALVATASAIRFALFGRIVASEHIYAALSAYLLAGIVFGVTHWTVESASPGSYGEAGGAPSRFSLTTALYFSFVTLATLGYGDVVPKTDATRGIAVVETVFGQLYIAVMIAHLVGARLNTRGEGQGPDGDDRGARRR
jgi:hypothetical protein